MELKTQRGYDFYEVASALQKSIRRGDVKLAGYMALELYPKYANYCWKRLLTISAEDCAGIITKEIEALHNAYEFINKGSKTPKGRVFITKAVILLCYCKHNRDADILSNYIYDKKATLDDEQIEKYFEEARANKITIPEYVFDVHTLKGKKKGKTKEDFFREEEEALYKKQKSLFDLYSLDIIK